MSWSWILIHYYGHRRVKDWTSLSLHIISRLITPVQSRHHYLSVPLPLLFRSLNLHILIFLVDMANHLDPSTRVPPMNFLVTRPGDPSSRPGLVRPGQRCRFRLAGWFSTFVPPPTQCNLRTGSSSVIRSGFCFLVAIDRVYTCV